MVSIRDRLEDLYPAAAIERVFNALQTPDVAGRLKEAMRRAGLKDHRPLEQIQQQVQRAWREARTWLDALSAQLEAGETSPSILNATGQLFHPTVDGVAVPISVAHAMASAASHVHHSQALRNRVQAWVLRHLHTHASWHVSLADALSLLLRGRTVLIAKSDMQRVAGLGGLDALLADCQLREVGATNGTVAEDWQPVLERLDAATAVILMVSPNGLAADQYHRQRQTTLDAAIASGVEVVELVGDATLDRTLPERYGMPYLPTVLDAHPGIVVIPLHLFLGAPGGCALFGPADCMKKLQRQSDLRGTSLSPAGLFAALTSLELLRTGAGVETGAIGRLLANPENLADRARRMAIQLAGKGPVNTAEEVFRHVDLGPAPWNRYRLDNWGVLLKTEQPAEEVRRRLEQGTAVVAEPMPAGGEPPAIPRIATAVQDDKLLIDLRFVEPKDDAAVIRTLVGEP
ncbi:MAG: hypothetical protein KatS3mg111_2576 [Pirellulaceae bacterium]|nr:MAG: hypothetical protein KatS3mg111_2576 [Pirellulaceae bacterium]